MRTLFVLITLLFSSWVAHAAPDSFVYEGYLENSGTPVNVVGATITAKIVLSSNTACVLYSKDISGVNITDGNFSIRLDGTSVTWFDTAATSTSAAKFRQIFQAGDFNGTNCSGATTASATDAREMHITYAGNTFTGISLEAVPFAVVASIAETATNLAPTADISMGLHNLTDVATPVNPEDAANKNYVDGLISTANTNAANASYMSSGTVNSARLPIVPFDKGGTGLSTAPAGQFLRGTGTGYEHVTITAGANITLTPGAGTLEIAATGGGGGITDLNGSAQTTQSFATPAFGGTSPNWSTNAGTGVHTLNVPMASTAGVTAGLISKTQYDVFNAKLSAVPGAPLAAAEIWVGDAVNTAVSRTLTGDVSMSNNGVVTIANNAINSTKISDGTVAAADLANGSLANTIKFFPAGISINRILATDAITGSTITQLDCTTTGYVLTWTLSGWACQATAGTGTVTSITAGTGLIGGPITASGTLSVNVGTSAGQIVQVQTGGKLPALIGSDLTGLGPAQISSAGASFGQALVWNGSSWAPGNTSDSTKLPLSGGLLSGLVSSSSAFQFSTANSAAAPSLRFVSNDTGFYGNGTNLSLSMGGSQLMNFVPSGVSIIGSLNLPSGSIWAANQIQAGQFLTGSGTAGAPTYSRDINTDTGMFFPNLDVIGFSTAGTKHVTINFDGKVGIGSTIATPTYPLQVSGSLAGMFMASVKNGTTNGSTFYRAANNSERSAFFGVAGTAHAGGGVYEANSAVIYSDLNLASLNIGTEGAQPIKFFTGNSQKMILSPSGNVGIGTPNPNANLDVMSGSIVPSGTVSTTTSLNTVLGFGTNFTTAFAVGDDIVIGTHRRKVASITNNVSMTVDTPMPETASYPRPMRVAVITDGGSYADFSGDIRVGGSVLSSFTPAPNVTGSFVGAGASALPHNNLETFVWTPSVTNSFLYCIKPGVPGQKLRILYKPPNGSAYLNINHNSGVCYSGEAKIFVMKESNIITGTGKGSIIELVYLPAVASPFAEDGWVVTGGLGFTY